MRIYVDKNIYKANVNNLDVNSATINKATINNLVVNTLDVDTLNANNGNINTLDSDIINCSNIFVSNDIYCSGQVYGFNSLSNQFMCKIVRNSSLNLIVVPPNVSTLITSLGINFGGFNNTHPTLKMFNGINSSYITIQKTGKYFISAQAGNINTPTIGQVNAFISIVKGIDIITDPILCTQGAAITSPVYRILNCSTVVNLNQGDILTLWCRASGFSTNWGTSNPLRQDTAFTLIAQLISL